MKLLEVEGGTCYSAPQLATPLKGIVSVCFRCPARTVHRGSTGPAEPLLRTTTTTNMVAANFVVKTCNN